MVYFLDSSALVKLYHPEKGSDKVEKLFTEPDRRILISRLACVEIVSALALKVRTGALEASASQALRLRFLAHVNSGEIAVLGIQGQHYTRAEELIALHGTQRGLRTLDAIHLAVALDVQERVGLDALVVADAALGETAEVLGLLSQNPEA